MTDIEKRNPPEGRVTLLFTDVEGSTKAWEQFGNVFHEALQRHDAIVRDAIERFNGFEVKTIGDSFMVAFETAAEAIRCAEMVQADLAAIDDSEGAWHTVGGIRIRIGLHTGEPNLRGRDYFGPDVNRAARVMDAGHGTMILISEETYLEGSPDMDDQIEFVDCGPHTLKDLGQPVRLYRVQSARTLPPPDRALRTLQAIPNNFPAQITAFVGRERELAELAAVLKTGRNRLVTLAGPGGTGKTRLAIQHAADSLQHYPGGVWLVELADIQDAPSVATAICLALSIELTPDADPRTKLIEFLKPRRSLLVLDNFEQVAEAAPLVSQLLRDCQTLTCLVTSREVLRVQGEREFVVDSLGVPPEGAESDGMQYDSVRLFVDRCRAYRPDFDLNEENATDVATICRRLDGIPLALELAAARVRAMSPHQINQRLAKSFDLLSSTQRDLPERQRTLRGAVDWSYELLTEDEREIFAEMGVFAGGFRLDAAEEVCMTPGALDYVFSLRDKSLLKADETDSEPRFRMLNTLKEYALEKLKASGRLEEMRDRAAAYFLQLCTRSNGALNGPGDAEAMSAMQGDLENLRSGMDWSVEAGNGASAVEYAKSMFSFLRRRGLYDECVQRLTTAEEIARDNGDRVSEARLLNQRGMLEIDCFRLDEAQALIGASYQISKELGDQGRMLVSLINLGNIRWGHGKSGEAKTMYEEALELAEATGQRAYAAVLRQNLGIISTEQGETEAAKTYFEASLAEHRKSKNQEFIADLLYNSAEVYIKTGELDQALKRTHESLDIYRKLVHQRGIGLAKVRLATILILQESAEEAIKLVNEAITIAVEFGFQATEMYACDVKGQIHAKQQNFAEATSCFARSIELGVRVDNRRHVSDVLTHMALVKQDDGDHKAAFTLFESARLNYERIGLTLDKTLTERVSLAKHQLQSQSVEPLLEAATLPALELLTVVTTGL